MDRLVPSLPTSDVERIRHYYTSELGFELVGEGLPDFVCVRRGLVFIEFYLEPERALCGKSVSFIESESVAELFAEFSDRMVEVDILSSVGGVGGCVACFSVSDLEGNVIIVGERSRETVSEEKGE